MKCFIIKGLFGCLRRVPTLSWNTVMYYVWWNYFNHFTARANISQTHSSLSFVLILGFVRQSPQIWQLWKYSILLRVLVNNMVFTEEERQKWIYTLRFWHWINSHCFTVRVIFSGATWLLQKTCFSQGKKQSSLQPTVNSSFFKFVDLIIITKSFKALVFQKMSFSFQYSE